MGCLAGMVINKKWNPEIPFAFTLKPDWVSVREIIKVGFPSTLVQILTSVVNMAMNAIIITFSSTASCCFWCVHKDSEYYNRRCSRYHKRSDSDCSVQLRQQSKKKESVSRSGTAFFTAADCFLSFLPCWNSVLALY